MAPTDPTPPGNSRRAGLPPPLSSSRNPTTNNPWLQLSSLGSTAPVSSSLQPRQYPSLQRIPETATPSQREASNSGLVFEAANTHQQGRANAESSALSQRTYWTEDEDAILLSMIEDGISWEQMAERLPGRSSNGCRVRFKKYLEHKTKKGQEELDDDWPLNQKLFLFQQVKDGVNVPELVPLFNNNFGTSRTSKELKDKYNSEKNTITLEDLENKTIGNAFAFSNISDWSLAQDIFLFECMQRPDDTTWPAIATAFNQRFSKNRNQLAFAMRHTDEFSKGVTLQSLRQRALSEPLDTIEYPDWTKEQDIFIFRSTQIYEDWTERAKAFNQRFETNRHAKILEQHYYSELYNCTTLGDLTNTTMVTRGRQHPENLHYRGQSYGSQGSGVEGSGKGKARAP